MQHPKTPANWRPKARRALIVLGVTLLLVAPYFLFKRWQHARFKTDYAYTEGVTSARFMVGTRFRHWHVAVAYNVAGKRYIEQVHHQPNIAPNQYCHVKYWPQNPNICEVHYDSLLTPEQIQALTSKPHPPTKDEM